MVRGLFVNFSIMVAMMTVGSMAVNVGPEVPRKGLRLVSHWAAILLAGVVLLQFPVPGAGGILFAFHAVPVALAGLYGGLSWGVVTGIGLAGDRLLLGGGAALYGAIAILLAGVVAGLLRVGGHGFSLPYPQLSWRALVIFVVADAPVLLVPGHGQKALAGYGLMMALLHSLGLLVCVSVLRTRLEAQRNLNYVTRLAHLDHLTGLPNRRALEKALAEYPAAEPGCFLLLDVDHFKHVNDQYGHTVGDAVLRHVATVLRRETRGDDLVCRYGGEEFAILLRRCSLHQATDASERIRQAVAAQMVQTEIGPVIVTVSGGLVPFGESHDLTEQMSEADRLLYQAKAEGRNRVIVA